MSTLQSKALRKHGSFLLRPTTDNNEADFATGIVNFFKCRQAGFSSANRIISHL